MTFSEAALGRWAASEFFANHSLRRDTAIKLPFRANELKDSTQPLLLWLMEVNVVEPTGMFSISLMPTQEDL